MLLKSYVLIASSSSPLVPGISLEGFLEYISPVMSIAYAACNITVRFLTLSLFFLLFFYINKFNNIRFHQHLQL